MSTKTLPRESTFQSFKLPHQTSYEPEVFLRRNEIPSFVIAAEANTNGWDAVNCIRLPIVNDALAKSGQYPTRLEMTIDGSTGWDITTEFDAWQVNQGGSGAILMMRLPLKTGTMHYTDGGRQTLSFTNGYALISIKLRYLPQPTTGRILGDNPLDVEQMVADAFARSADDPAVVVQKVNYGSANPNDLVQSLFVAALSLLLNENLDKFTHVFSVVNLNQKAAQDKYAWLKPTYTSYAYYEGLDENSCYLAVLNQTEGRSVDGLTNQAPGSAIPKECEAAILISMTLFLQKVVLPGLTRTFTKAPTNAFVLKNLGQVIENTTRIEMDKVKVAASSYTPYLDEFVLHIVGDEIQMQTRISVNISPGINAYINAVYYNTIGLVKKDDQTMTLDFEQSRPPNIESYYTIASGIIITQVLVALIGTVIASIAYEALKEVTWRVIIVALITIVSGIAAATPTFIAEAVQKGLAAVLPGIGPLVDDASDPVRWPGSSGFTVKTAELNGSFQLGGMLAR